MSQVSVGVNVAVYPVVYVTNEVMNLFLRIIDRRGLNIGYVNRNYQTIYDGLRTWITTRHLRKAVLEIYDSETDRVAERHDISFEYTAVVPSRPNSSFRTNIEGLEDFLSRLGYLPRNVTYRIVVVLEENAPHVRGWTATSLRPTDHLQQTRIGGMIEADYIGATYEYWGGN